MSTFQNLLKPYPKYSTFSFIEGIFSHEKDFSDLLKYDLHVQPLDSIKKCAICLIDVVDLTKIFLRCRSDSTHNFGFI